MYQYTYGEILADSPVDARAQERLALDHAIGLLRAAHGSEPGAPAEQDAIDFTTRMWGLFISDLAHPGNDLPEAVRARLMSVGLWVMAELQRVERGECRTFDAVAEICSLIRDGLD